MKSTYFLAESGEKLASPAFLEQAAKAAEGVADELARAEGREVTLYEDPAPPLQLLLPDDGFSCDVVQGVPPGMSTLKLELKFRFIVNIFQVSPIFYTPYKPPVFVD